MPRLPISDPRVQGALMRRGAKQERRLRREGVLCALKARGERMTLAELMDVTEYAKEECGEALDCLLINGVIEREGGLYGLRGVL